MKAHQIQFAVYLAGVLLLGFFYYELKHAVSAAVLLIGIVAYLVALRIVAHHLAKLWAPDAARDNGDV